MPEFEISPSPVQYDFFQSTAPEVLLVGPRGEGKTEAGIMAMLIHADRQPKELRPIPWAIIRDTWSNLQRTTLRSFLAPWPDSFAASIRSRLEIREGGREISLPGWWTAFLFGVDSAADLNKLQSLQLGGLWGEEFAPVMEQDISSLGVAEEMWLLGQTSLRYPCVTRAQITQNYPSKDHWTWQRFAEQHLPQCALFRIPRGENKHVRDEYRLKMEQALQGRPDLLDRLVLGKPSDVYIGEKVTPEYNEDLHRSMTLLPLLSAPVIRCWDGGQTPACVFVQIAPSGKIHVLDTLQAQGMGMQQFIETQVRGLMASRYPDAQDWQDSGDPSLSTPEQSDSMYCAAQIINKTLKARFIPGEPSWQARREWIKERLIRDQILLSPHEKILHRALSGGWHYKRAPSGEVIKDLPEKDMYSHAIDAFCHAMTRLFAFPKRDPVKGMTTGRLSWQQPAERERPRWL